jgi:hypothetical protein
MGFFNRKNKPKRTLDEMIKREEGEGMEVIEVDEVDTEATDEDDLLDKVAKGRAEREKRNSEEIKQEEETPLNPWACFGLKEDKTDKWMIKCTQGWYAVMSFFWFLLGALTFAPIIFIANKVNAVFKNRNKSLIMGIVIWFGFIGLIVLLIVTRNVEAVQEVENVVTPNVSYGVSDITETTILP